MKKCLLLVMAMLLVWTAAWAEEEYPGPVEYTIEGDTLYVAEGTVGLGNIEVNDLEMKCYPGLYGDEDGFRGVKRIVLPSTLRVMGWEAVNGCNVEELVLPEGLEVFRDPFYGVSLDRIVLPSTLQSVRGRDLHGAMIREIRVAEDSPWMTSRDGVLFSKDGSTLICYPNGRTEEHYDVPAGVRAIAEDAFADCGNLKSVSLPVGLKSIGQYAFSGCGRLLRINVPLTVTEIGSYAFAHCVSLQQVALPSALQGLLESAVSMPEDAPWPDADEFGTVGVFANCPALLSGFEGDNGGTGGQVDHEQYIVQEGEWVRLIADPEKASGTIPVYAERNTRSRVVARLSCGASVTAWVEGRTWAQLERGEQDDFYYVDEPGFSGYVRREDMVCVRWQDGLFEVYNAAVRGRSVKVYSEADPKASYWKVAVRNPDDFYISVGRLDQAPWVFGAGNGVNGYVFMGDLTLERERTGDGRTYGVVIASEPANRVNLREKPDKKSRSIGKYFTGTHAEILQDAGRGFWQVRIRGQEGYMMKEYVRIVEEAAE